MKAIVTIYLEFEEEETESTLVNWSKWFWSVMEQKPMLDQQKKKKKKKKN